MVVASLARAIVLPALMVLLALIAHQDSILMDPMLVLIAQLPLTIHLPALMLLLP